MQEMKNFDDFSEDSADFFIVPPCQDYEELLKLVKGKLPDGYDLDLLELFNGATVWETGMGTIYYRLHKSNVWAVTARHDNIDLPGKCSTFDFDEYGLTSCVLSATKDLLNI